MPKPWEILYTSFFVNNKIYEPINENHTSIVLPITDNNVYDKKSDTYNYVQTYHIKY